MFAFMGLSTTTTMALVYTELWEKVSLAVVVPDLSRSLSSALHSRDAPALI